MFLDVDMFLTPTRFTVASKINEPLDASPLGNRPAPKSRGLNGLIPAGNLAGLPALSLPCGFADQLPIAISLVGRPFSEGHLISLGSAYQSKTDWHRRHPTVEST
jgi:aspartyl-tRNA(Asn)/glutamyl-tRNA(Gln) amidotransferase subunit A